jgi:hypothetical protein
MVHLTGELTISFSYEPNPAKQKELNAAAEQAILNNGDAALVRRRKGAGK